MKNFLYFIVSVLLVLVILYLFALGISKLQFKYLHEDWCEKDNHYCLESNTSFDKTAIGERVFEELVNMPSEQRSWCKKVYCKPVAPYQLKVDGVTYMYYPLSIKSKK